MLYSSNACVIVVRISVALFPRSAKKFMHTRCRIRRKIVSSQILYSKRGSKNPAHSTQLREILYTDSQDMLGLSSTVASRYTDGITSHGIYGSSAVQAGQIALHCSDGLESKLKESDRHPRVLEKAVVSAGLFGRSCLCRQALSLVILTESWGWNRLTYGSLGPQQAFQSATVTAPNCCASNDYGHPCFFYLCISLH
jgi:hypothetical protein